MNKYNVELTETRVRTIHNMESEDADELQKAVITAYEKGNIDMLSDSEITISCDCEQVKDKKSNSDFIKLITAIESIGEILLKAIKEEN